MKLRNSKYAEHFHWTISLIHDLYKIHSNTKSRDLAEYFDKFACFTEILFKLMMVGFVVSAFVFMLYPIYMYFVEGELIPIIPLYLPFLDEKTIIGFILLNLYLLVVTALGVISFSAIEFLMAIIIISSLIFAKLISIQLQNINIDLQDDDCVMLTVIGRFRNIFLMHQEMGEYGTFFHYNLTIAKTSFQFYMLKLMKIPIFPDTWNASIK